jgi:hypothetical protein
VAGKIHGDCHENADRHCKKPTDIPHSFCGMQVQPGPTGLVLDSKTYHFAKPGEVGIKGDDLDNDDVLCNRAALHKMRESMMINHDLSIYTGEKKGGKYSQHRLYGAQNWFLSHDPNAFYSYPEYKLVGWSWN